MNKILDPIFLLVEIIHESVGTNGLINPVVTYQKRRNQNPVKHLRRNFFRKYFTAESLEVFMRTFAEFQKY